MSTLFSFMLIFFVSMQTIEEERYPEAYAAHGAEKMQHVAEEQYVETSQQRRHTVSVIASA